MNATKKHNQIAKATMAMLMMMLTIGLTSPAVIALNEPAGSATSTNVSPEVISVTAPSSVDPQVEYNFSCTVQDNNTLADIDNVVLKVFLTTADEGAADAIENHYTFTFTAVDNVWTETGPGPDNDHLITTSCTYPSDLALQSDNYEFAIKLSAAATIGSWTAKWIATDEALSGSDTVAFSVTGYISLEIDDTTLTFSGSPGDMDIQPSPEQQTVCTVNTNYTFKIEAKLSADWLGGTHGGTIGMENTEAAQTAGKENVVTLSNAYAIVWTDVAPGEPVVKDIYWFLDLPVPLRDDVYTTTFYVQAVTI